MLIWPLGVRAAGVNESPRRAWMAWLICLTMVLLLVLERSLLALPEPLFRLVAGMQLGSWRLGLQAEGGVFGIWQLWTHQVVFDSLGGAVLAITGWWLAAPALERLPGRIGLVLLIALAGPVSVLGFVALEAPVAGESAIAAAAAMVAAAVAAWPNGRLTFAALWPSRRGLAVYRGHVPLVGVALAWLAVAAIRLLTTPAPAAAGLALLIAGLGGYVVAHHLAVVARVRQAPPSS